ncbi:MAG: fatty acid desaturase [Myxococcota bacterium]|jgi:stearoyl-CoA desaturase (delta-9 desaturase)|nr:fatty acid desaturase [Myxococcota bacterium]
MYILACLAVFFGAYLLQITMISAFYHRALAHESLVLQPWLKRFVAQSGMWFTGLDPKAWVCMHRMHHEHSDTALDPHSPVHYGFFGVLRGQLRSYERTLVRLAKGDPAYTSKVADLDFPTNWMNRHRLWGLPYVAHFLVALAIALSTGFWIMAAGYWLGMMSHPIQGWLVNSLGHAVGSRNFNTPDNARNNTLAAWLIFGEGFQNNHHQYPASAKFSYRKTEVDLGYGLCLLMERCKLLRIERATLIPSPKKKSPETFIGEPVTENR